MQSSAPDLLDTSKETKQTPTMYGADTVNTFARTSTLGINSAILTRKVVGGTKFGGTATS